jgi:hypothetical protein
MVHIFVSFIHVSVSLCDRFGHELFKYLISSYGWIYVMCRCYITYNSATQCYIYFHEDVRYLTFIKTDHNRDVLDNVAKAWYA